MATEFTKNKWIIPQQSVSIELWWDLLDLRAFFYKFACQICFVGTRKAWVATSPRSDILGKCE